MTKLRIFLVLFAWGSAAFAQAYHPADAYRYVSSLGSDSNDGLSPGTAFATPQHCNAVVVALGGGTCDARTLYHYTYGNGQGPILVGQHSPNIGATLLLPPYGTWTCNITGGTSDCLEVFNYGSAIGASSGQGNPFTIIASPTSSVIDVCGTDPSISSAYLHMEGLHCVAQAGATASGAVVNIQNLFDVSRVTDIVGESAATGVKAIWVHGVYAGAMVERVKGSGDNVAGNVPCTLGAVNGENEGGDIGPISCTNSGSGSSAVSIVQASGSAAAHYHDIYIEMNVATDTSTPAITVTGSSGLADELEVVKVGGDAAGNASTRCILDIANNSSVIVRNLTQNNSTCAINDHTIGRGIINLGDQAVITDYSTENVCCALASSFASLAASGIRNDKGLQLFETTTTCSTGATINSPCTTAEINLPVGYQDTNYRLQCQGLGPTNFPQLQTVTKSNATFTITVNNLTAAAASYNSFDCLAAHN
jgi:hypothetical protein